MSVRISRESGDPGTVIRIDGRLRSEHLGALLDECRSADAPLVLDLSGLLACDEAGVDALAKLIAKGVRVRGASPYIELLLAGNRYFH